MIGRLGASISRDEACLRVRIRSGGLIASLAQRLLLRCNSTLTRSIGGGCRVIRGQMRMEAEVADNLGNFSAQSLAGALHAMSEFRYQPGEETMLAFESEVVRLVEKFTYVLSYGNGKRSGSELNWIPFLQKTLLAQSVCRVLKHRCM